MPPESAEAPDPEVRQFLHDAETIDLERSVIAGQYVRYDERSRSALKEFRRRVLEGLAAQSLRPNNFLIWGRPGSGKSFLVQEVAAAAPGVRLFEVNLAQLDAAGLAARLAEVRDHAGDAVCLLDEVDAHAGEGWPYELLLPALEPSPLPRHRITFCLAGSGGTTFDEFRQILRGRPKGSDLLSRIPRGNEVEVAPLRAGDRMLVAVAQLLAAAEEEGRPVREVEKLALYYIATTPGLGSARQLRALASESARRIPAGEDRVRYDYLFAAGDPENKRFWNRSRSVRETLADRFLPVHPAPRAARRAGGPGPAPAPSAEPHRIAILPFLNISPNPADAYFADGLTEELIAAVSRIGGLRVIARTSVMRYKDGTRTAAEAAKELQVGTLLEGSVRKAGDDLRVTAQLIDVHNEEPLWSTSYDRRLENVFAIQEELARQIAQSLHVQLVRGKGGSIAPAPPKNLAAYELYLRGRHMFQQVSRFDLEGAIQLFQQAIDLEPTFALAHCLLAEAHALSGNRGYVPLGPALERADLSARRAIELDPTLAEAHAALAPIHFNRYQWSAALAELDQALAIDASHAMAHSWRAVVLGCLGRPGDGLLDARRARELDPLNPRKGVLLAQQLYWMRRYDEALAVLREPAVSESPDSRTFAAYSLLMSGRPDEAVASARAARDDPRSLRVRTRMDLAAILAHTGHRDDARRLLEELRHPPGPTPEPVPAGAFAWVLLALGEYDAAVEEYKRAREERSMMAVEDLLVDPSLDGFRASPRFAEVVGWFFPGVAAVRAEGPPTGPSASS